MTEEENVALIRRAYEALQRDGVEGIIEFIDPEFEVETPAALAVEPQVYRGPDGVRRWFDTFLEVMDEVNLEADEFIPAGDRVVVPGRVVARGRDSGIETGQPVTQVWTIRDGKGVRMDIYAKKQEALRALGLAE